MGNANNARMLWISDIHYKGEYEDNAEIILMVSNLIKYLKRMDHPPTHLVITGDITQNGESGDYTIFKQKIYDPIIKALPSIKKGIVVPGNHDVEWSKVEALYATSSPVTKDRSNIVIDKNTFKGIFKGYMHPSNKTKGVVLHVENDEPYKNFLKVDKEGYYGYFYDPDCNILFILINSAWLSFGAVPNEKISDEIIKGLSIHGMKETAERFKAVNKNTMVEYGNQTYAFHLFKNSSLLKEIMEIKENKNPTILSMAHHPVSWLDWYEVNSENYPHEAPLNELFRLSSLHLTGHEHASPNWGNLLGGSCLNLSTGMFLDSSVEGGKGNHGIEDDQNLFPNNWVSILELKGDILTQECLKLDAREGGVFEWEAKSQFAYRFNADGSVCRLEKEHAAAEEAEIHETDGEVQIVQRNVNQAVIYDYFKKKLDGIRPKMKKSSIDSIERKYWTVVNPGHSFRIVLDSGKDGAYNDEFLLDVVNYLVDQKDVMKNFPTILISLMECYEIVGRLSDSQDDEVLIKTRKLESERELIYNSFKHRFFTYLVKENPELFKLLRNSKFTFAISYK